MKKPTLREKAESSRPDSMIAEGPVLCLDIDGVSAPLGQGGRFDIENPPPRFLGYGVVQWHPALKDWFEQLEQSYRQVTWISSWNTMAAGFAQDVGSASGQSWPTIFPPPGEASLQECRKIFCCMKWIDENVPLAIVDDHFCVFDEEELDRLYSRRGPTLVISPDKMVGLGQALIDLLVEFSNDPWQPRFEPDHPWVMYSDKRLKWVDGSTLDPKGWPTERGGLRKMQPHEEMYFKSGSGYALQDFEEYVYKCLGEYRYPNHYPLIAATQLARVWRAGKQKPFSESWLDEFLIPGLRETTKRTFQHCGFLVKEGEGWQPGNAACVQYLLEHAEESYEAFCTDLKRALDDSFGNHCATMVAARIFQAWEDNQQNPLTNHQIRAVLKQVDESRVNELFGALYDSKFITGEKDDWKPTCPRLGQHLVQYVENAGS